MPDRLVVKALVEAEHQVQALSRSIKDEALLQGLGACPLEADLFDVQALIHVLFDVMAHVMGRKLPLALPGPLLHMFSGVT